MAAEGFNICIVARNETKMQEKLAEIVKKYGSNIKTKYIIADFSQLKSIADYKETIGKKLADIDIAMLFLNAGYAQIGPFADIHEEDVEKQIDCNVNHVAYTAKVLVKQMIARKNPGAIIITSSIAAHSAGPGVLTYCATKSFADYIGEGLFYELEGDKIDVLSWRCGHVQTNMNRREPKGEVLNTYDAVKGMLFDLGKVPTTQGHKNHAYS